MNKLKAVILAAGVGQRLGQKATHKPKSLLQFQGVNLLQRHLQILKHYGVSNIIVVTGYEAAQIQAELTNSAGTLAVETVYNPEYEKGSVISMLRGLQALSATDDLILMDADVLYDHRILGRLIHTNIANCFMLDRDFIAGEEPVKLCVKQGQLIEFRKQIDKDLVFDYQGESVGFFRFTNAIVESLAKCARDTIERGDDEQPYEECIRNLLLKTPQDFSFEDITGLAWIEIDFPEDIHRAENDILPLLSQLD